MTETPEAKLLKHHIEGIDLLSKDELGQLVRKHIEKGGSYYSLMQETKKPMSTLYGWANKNKVDKQKKEAKENFNFNGWLKLGYNNLDDKTRINAEQKRMIREIILKLMRLSK